jgi:hypothetical protein
MFCPLHVLLDTPPLTPIATIEKLRFWDSPFLPLVTNYTGTLSRSLDFFGALDPHMFVFVFVYVSRNMYIHAYELRVHTLTRISNILGRHLLELLPSTHQLTFACLFNRHRHLLESVPIESTCSSRADTINRYIFDISIHICMFHHICISMDICMLFWIKKSIYFQHFHRHLQGNLHVHRHLHVVLNR